MELIKGTAGINKAIDSIQKRGKRLDNDIQHAGLSILAHVQEHGDTTLADRLFNAMPKGSRRKMLAEWLVAFGAMRTLSPKDKADAERIKAGAVFGYDKERTTDMQGATETPWYEMRKQEEASEAFDAQASVKAVLARLSKAAETGREVTHKQEAAQTARELLAILEG